MEITIQLQNVSLQFFVQEKLTRMEKTYNLYVLEPSGNNLIGSDISFDSDREYDVVNFIARYISQMSSIVKKDDKKIVLRETSVSGKEHTTVYYDSFLDHLHAAGYIDTDYIQIGDSDEDAEHKIVVFVDSRI
jgi:hypothetical protein